MAASPIGLALGGSSLHGTTTVQTVADAAMDAKHALRVQQAKLRDVLAYVEKHRVFRYCRVVLLAQGVGASAALKLLADLNPSADPAAADEAGAPAAGAWQKAAAAAVTTEADVPPDLSSLSLFRLRAVSARSSSSRRAFWTGIILSTRW